MKNYKGENVKKKVSKKMIDILKIGKKDKNLGYTGLCVPTNKIKELTHYLDTLNECYDENNLKITQYINTYDKQFKFVLNVLFYIRDKISNEFVEKNRKINETYEFAESKYNKCEPNNTFDSFDNSLKIIPFLKNNNSYENILFNLLVFNCHINLIYSGALHHKNCLFNPDVDGNNYYLEIDEFKTIMLDSISIRTTLIFIRLILNNKLKRQSTFLIDIENFITKSNLNLRFERYNDYFINFLTTEKKYFGLLYNSINILNIIPIVVKVLIRTFEHEFLKNTPDSKFILLKQTLHTDFHKTWFTVLSYIGGI